MRGWLIYDAERAAANRDYIRMHRELAREFRIDLRLVMDTEIPRLLDGEKGDDPDFCFVRTIRPRMSKELEKRGIRLFNPARISELCNDKGKTIRFVETHTGVPVIPTECFAGSELTRELLSQRADTVIKSVDGHGGGQVFLTSHPYEEIVRGIDRSDFILQPLVRGPGKDIRVYVIGGRIMGAVERTARSGFRANYSLGAQIRPWKPDEKVEGYVREICDVLPFGMAGIDFIAGQSGDFLFNEIEDVVGARMFYHCYPQTDLLREYFLYVMKCFHTSA